MINILPSFFFFFTILFACRMEIFILINLGIIFTLSSRRENYIVVKMQKNADKTHYSAIRILNHIKIHICAARLYTMFLIDKYSHKYLFLLEQNPSNHHSIKEKYHLVYQYLIHSLVQETVKRFLMRHSP